MGLYQSNFSCVGRLFLLGIVGCLALMIQMPCAEAVLQCASGERYVTKTYKGNWQLVRCEDSCPNEIRTQCQNDNNRVVSKIKCNWWDPRTGSVFDEYATCEGCCGKSLPTPPPALTKECQAGERSKIYTIPAFRPWNCTICEDKCKAECGSTEELRETCVLNYVNEASDHSYTCRCCCKSEPASPPPPPPSPPPPSPSPPPPSPPPPSPLPCPSCPPPDNTCDTKDMYVAFYLSGTDDCNLCADYCKRKCSKLDSALASECCMIGSSSVQCKCCCTNE
ncbi:gamete and mating-type specific protein A-like [Papaver somniferum]|uniref:gamete and mating-type specific protein A-like n=1 Tax=Papaver somniferum TaxID=3469 RepID=UPI000E6F6267|nr:gamete and mating-type specific protein A-like [Papaver somniferum]